MSVQNRFNCFRGEPDVVTSVLRITVQNAFTILLASDLGLSYYIFNYLSIIELALSNHCSMIIKVTRFFPGQVFGLIPMVTSFMGSMASTVSVSSDPRAVMNGQRSAHRV